MSVLTRNQFRSTLVAGKFLTYPYDGVGGVDMVAPIRMWSAFDGTNPSGDCITFEDIQSAIQTTTTVSGLYQTIAAMSNYLTTSVAAATYQTLAAMSNYLTTSVAATTYQTLAAMSNYLTTSVAATTYQTIAGMSNYASLSANNTLTGNTTFTKPISVCVPVQQTDSYNRITQAGLALRGYHDPSDCLYMGPDVTQNNGCAMIQAAWDSSTQASTIYSPLGINPNGGSVCINKFPQNNYDNSIALDVNGLVACGSIKLGATAYTETMFADFLTMTSAATIYLTQAVATATYQTIAGMSGIVSTLSSINATLIDITNRLSNMPTLDGLNYFSNFNLFGHIATTRLEIQESGYMAVVHTANFTLDPHYRLHILSPTSGTINVHFISPRTSGQSMNGYYPVYEFRNTTSYAMSFSVGGGVDSLLLLNNTVIPAGSANYVYNSINYCRFVYVETNQWSGRWVQLAAS